LLVFQWPNRSSRNDWLIENVVPLDHRLINSSDLF
jgi:hypothetical protein